MNKKKFLRYSKWLGRDLLHCSLVRGIREHKREAAIEERAMGPMYYPYVKEPQDLIDWKESQGLMGWWDNERPEDLTRNMGYLATAGDWITPDERLMRARSILTAYLQQSREFAVDYQMLIEVLQVLEKLSKVT